MKLTRKPARVNAKSTFFDQTGRFKCSGPLSAFPFNPYPIERCPPFEVGMNGEWFLCEIVDAADAYGWVAAAVSDLKADLETFPRVRLER